ncbi:MAG: Uncharacterized protein CEN87_299 [Parcubacteria group bacterium Licking1014_1]|nr:MAG: Uncharacterized protein CEN87_299 [Parcubacteria group bacterium Licking1014_1]
MSEKEIKKTKREISAGEQRVKFSEEAEEIAEKKEDSLENETIVAEQLKREIEAMEIDDSLKEEAKKKAEKIDFLGEKEKIERLLEIAKEKGVVFSVQVAQNMEDPFILDIFHDILAKEGYYKQFIK